VTGKIVTNSPVSQFIQHHFRHFNAAALVDAAKGYCAHLEKGGKMMVTLAGAMSTAELGLSLAEMIRQGKVHAISCTGANLEEDIFNLIAHDFYERVPHYRDLSPQQEQELLERHMNRVTDTCIPEEEAMRRLEKALLEEWIGADQAGERYFPHEFLYRILRSGRLEPYYQINPRDSWVYAAMEANLPIYVPGWEDSTTGNMYAAHCITGEIRNVHTVRTGIEYMIHLADWYTAHLGGVLHRLLSNWRRHSRGFPHLCGTHAPSRPGPPGRAHVGLFLPDQRLHHQLRLLLGSSAQ
jgi:deoxyhypusine synthase